MIKREAQDLRARVNDEVGYLGIKARASSYPGLGYQNPERDYFVSATWAKWDYRFVWFNEKEYELDKLSFGSSPK